jgi:hypothetical protein
LTPQQSENITSAVKQFAGTHFAVAVFNDPESVNLAAQIENVLAAAGWVEVSWKGGGDISFTRTGHPNAGFTLLQGLFIQSDLNRINDLGPATKTLTLALRTAGIEAKGEIGRMPPNDSDLVQIQIGKK